MPLPDLDIRLKPSRLYGFGLFALHLLTYLVLSTVDFPGPLHGLLWVLVFLLSLRAWHHWRGLARWCRLIVRGDRIQLSGASQQSDGALGAQKVQAAWLVLLSLRLDSGALWMPILPDSLSSEDWRRLRVWLNSEGLGGKH